MSEPNPPNERAEPEVRDWDSLARAAALASGEAETFDEVVELLAFDLGGSPYAIPVDRVREIVRVRPITPIPRVPEDVRGVISLRGEIIQVVDLRRRLGLEPIQPTRATRIIVAYDSESRMAAMLVDAVREVLRVPSDAIRPSPASDSGAIEALCAYGDQFVSMVELDRVLNIDA